MELSDKIWWTKKAQIQTEKRFLSHDFHTKSLLFFYALYSCIFAVYYLKNPSKGLSDVGWVSFSVLILGLTGFISGFYFKERARVVKEGYESLGKLYNQVTETDADLAEISKEYDRIISVYENHTDQDFHIALCETYLCNSNPNTNLTKHPTTYIKFLFIVYKTFKFLSLLILYFFPLVLFAFLEFYKCP